MCHFTPTYPLNTPFKANITCDCLLLCLVYSQTLKLPPGRKVKHPLTLTLNPNPITTAASRQSTSLQRSHFPFIPLQFSSHPPNKYFTILLGIPNSCFFITPIIIFYPLINFPSQSPLVGQAIAIKLFLIFNILFLPLPTIPNHTSYTKRWFPFSCSPTIGGPCFFHFSMITSTSYTPNQFPPHNSEGKDPKLVAILLNQNPPCTTS